MIYYTDEYKCLPLLSFSVVLRRRWLSPVVGAGFSSIVIRKNSRSSGIKRSHILFAKKHTNTENVAATASR